MIELQRGNVVDLKNADVIKSCTSKLMNELRGFAPIGMLECWNFGILGSGIMEWWV